MVMTSEGTGSPVNMSLGSAASTSLSRGVRSSPSTAAIRSETPAAPAASSNARAHAAGFNAPALVTTLIPRSWISASSGARTLTASLTKPASGFLLRARARSAMVISER